MTRMGPQYSANRFFTNISKQKDTVSRQKSVGQTDKYSPRSATGTLTAMTHDWEDRDNDKIVYDTKTPITWPSPRFDFYRYTNKWTPYRPPAYHGE